jgi:hypothetical protein
MLSSGEAESGLGSCMVPTGRVYWETRRDEEAFRAFVEAAKRGSSAAKKYIGDAFLEGRGLPTGEAKGAHSADIAMRWYKEACGKICDPSATTRGFPLARKALNEVKDFQAKQAAAAERTKAEAEKAKFDPSIFQNPRFMSALYYNRFDPDSDDLDFNAYVLAVTEKLGGNEMFFIDQSCAPLVSLATTAAIAEHVIVLLGFPKMNALNPQQSYMENPLGMIFGMFGGGIDLLTSDKLQQIQILGNQGRNDTIALEKRYDCKSEVVQTIALNLASKFGSATSQKSSPSQPRRSPEQPAQPSASAEQPTQSPPYKQGWDHARTWQTWLDSLDNETKEGAEFWAAARNDRSQRTPLPCADGTGRISAAFRKGCAGAKGILDVVDQNRKAQPEYRQGWNEYLQGRR